MRSGLTIPGSWVITTVIASVDDGDRLNLDQVPRLGERLHSEQRVGGLVVTEDRDPGLRDLRYVLRPVPNDVNRDPGHMLRSGTCGGEAAADVGERLAGLSSQVAGTDKIALSVVGYLSGDEHQPMPVAAITWV